MSEFGHTIGTKSKAHSNLIIRIESILVTGLVMLSSCAHYRCDPAYIGPKSRDAEMLEYYSYPGQDIKTEIETISEKRKYIIKRIEFPSALNVFGTENITIDYYQQKKPGKFPAVVILPVSNHIDFAVKSFARHFASGGFNCAIVHNRDFDLKKAQSAEDVEYYFRQTVLDNRQVLDFLVAREEVDENKLACLSFSLGGIKASLITAVDERVKYSVLGLAGGSFADVATLSGKKAVKENIRELGDIGADPEYVHSELTYKVATDPLKLAEYIDARNVLMFIAAFDRVIPRECGDRLREAIGKPEVIYLPTGHYGSFLFLPYAEAKSLSFLKKKFELK